MIECSIRISLFCALSLFSMLEIQGKYAIRFWIYISISWSSCLYICTAYMSDTTRWVPYRSRSSCTLVVQRDSQLQQRPESINQLQLNLSHDLSRYYDRLKMNCILPQVAPEQAQWNLYMAARAVDL